jgi:hypothetical protein
MPRKKTDTTESLSQSTAKPKRIRKPPTIKYNPKFPTHAYAQIIVDHAVEQNKLPKNEQKILYCKAEVDLAKNT